MIFFPAPRSGSLALLTDLYQLTMAYGYWKSGTAEKEAVFNLFFRKHPFGGGLRWRPGWSTWFHFLQSFRFSEEDTDYLATLTGNDGNPLFEEGFLKYLRECSLPATWMPCRKEPWFFPNSRW
jgi:nicotinate phosphoribosyltransferase